MPPGHGVEVGDGVPLGQMCPLAQGRSGFDIPPVPLGQANPASQIELPNHDKASLVFFVNTVAPIGRR